MTLLCNSMKQEFYRIRFTCWDTQKLPAIDIDGYLFLRNVTAVCREFYVEISKLFP